MPLYEYLCETCAHRFEVIQRFSDPPIDVCPKCGGAVAKLLSSPAIQFKGSGWYITDYARAGKADATNAAGKTDTGGKTDAGGKTDTPAASGEASAPKADAKSEAKPKPTASSSSD